MSILQARNVHYIYQSKYQKVHAVKGIDFTFEEGKFYAIVGKSGCGKTTILSMLAGLDLPTEGEIVYDGKSTAERNRDEYRLRAISLICQSYNLFPLLTVEENVLYPMLLRKAERNSGSLEGIFSSVGMCLSHSRADVVSKVLVNWMSSSLVSAYLLVLGRLRVDSNMFIGTEITD